MPVAIAISPAQSSSPDYSMRFPPPNDGEGTTLQGSRIETTDGRSVLVRTCFGTEAVQIAIVGKRGGMQEAVSFNVAQLPSLIRCLEALGQELHPEPPAPTKAPDLIAVLSERASIPRAPTRCPRGHRLTQESSHRNSDGTRGCRECRGLRNTYYRQALGLPPATRREKAALNWRFLPEEEDE